MASAFISASVSLIVPLFAFFTTVLPYSVYTISGFLAALIYYPGICAMKLWVVFKMISNNITNADK